MPELQVVTLPYLIALKLYGGGGKAIGDVIELIERRPDLDVRSLVRSAGGMA